MSDDSQAQIVKLVNKTAAESKQDVTLHCERGNISGNIQTVVQSVSATPTFPDDGMLTKTVSYFFGLQATLTLSDPQFDLQGKMRSYEIYVQAVAKGLGNEISVVEASPASTSGSTNYSNSVQYTVGGNVGFFDDTPTGGISGSASITSGKSRVIQDVSVKQDEDNDDNNVVRFIFQVNNQNSDIANGKAWMDVQAVYRVDGINPFLIAYLDNRTTYDDILTRSKQYKKDSSFNFVLRVVEKHDGGESMARPIVVKSNIPSIFTPLDDTKKFYDENPHVDPINQTYQPSPAYVGDRLIFDPYYPDGGGNNTLQSDEGNNVYTRLLSPNTEYSLALRNGNLVLQRSNGGYIWASNTSIPNSFFVLQEDKNLCIYQQGGLGVASVKKWSDPGSGSSKYSTLVLQDDGNLVNYDANGNPLWSSRFDTIRRTLYIVRPDQHAYDVFATTYNNDACFTYSGSHSSQLYISWSSNVRDWQCKEIPYNNADTADVVSFKGWLYVGYKSYDNNDILTVRTQNYTDWQGNRLTNAFQTEHAFGLGVLGDYMYILHRGTDGNLYSIRTSDGVNWGDPTNIWGQSAFTVSLTTFQNKLYMVYSGEHSSQLYVSWTSDGTVWDYQQIDGQYANIVGLTASNSWMYIAYSSAHSSDMYVSQSSDGTTWSPAQTLNDQHGSSTAATFVNGQLVIVYSSSPPINVMAYTE